MIYFVLVLLVGLLLFLRKKNSREVDIFPNCPIGSVQYASMREYYFEIPVAGVPHYDYEKACMGGKLVHGKDLSLKREPNNEFDRKAVAIYAAQYKIGYVPRKVSFKIANQIDSNDIFEIKILDHDPGNKNDFEILKLGLLNTTLKNKKTIDSNPS